LVRAPNLAVLSRDECPPSLHVVVMLSWEMIQEPGDGEAADSALRKMALLDMTATSWLGDVRGMCTSAGGFLSDSGRTVSEGVGHA